MHFEISLSNIKTNHSSETEDRVKSYINYVNFVTMSLIFVCLYLFLLIIILLSAPPFSLAVVLLLLISENFILTLVVDSLESLLLEGNGISFGTCAEDFSWYSSPFTVLWSCPESWYLAIKSLKHFFKFTFFQRLFAVQFSVVGGGVALAAAGALVAQSFAPLGWCLFMALRRK